eukprot:TRINITY_DN7908_c0_g1_i2.p2 TRINITY_DN7908_c0_g1~~TRINITY_DN7908_c0_g1_i2.p2  ORF type:complete len:135 (-),score=18.57 TRINITY_DN7908_c0_g1_i2:33-437(-)
MFDISFIPAFKDNYIWLLTRGKRAFVVDPGDAAPVQARLEVDGLMLEGIMITHHHADHQGGVAELKTRWHAEVYAPPMYSALIPVSYTHLTLPTICSVQISVVAVSLKKKKNRKKNIAQNNDKQMQHTAMNITC